MRTPVLVFAFVSILSSSFADAATEYLRFQGFVHPSYGELYDYYDPQFGLSGGQNVYFDFSVDTALEAPGHTDTFYQDFFAVSYLGGSVSGAGDTVGESSSFPEGITTWLFIVDSLRVGTSWGWLDNPSDESIDTWSVGKGVALMNLGYFSEHIFGSLTMTYRGATIPPAIIPVPAAVWLYGSALVMLGWIMSKSI